MLTYQGTLCLSFSLKLLGLNVPLLEIDRAVVNAKGADHAVAIEPLFSISKLVFSRIWKEKGAYRIVLDERRELRIRHHTVEGTVNLVRDRAMDFQTSDFALESAGLHEPGKLR